MKGIIFTEFLEMVEQQYGISLADKIVHQPNIDIDSYTAVGSYPHGQMVNLVINLSNETGIPIPDLLKTYGRHLFGQLAKQYPQMISGIDDPLRFLEIIESHIHVEVKKLYPDSKPPSLLPQRISDHELKLTYKSHRQMADVAEGLILGCADYFNSPLSIRRNEASDGCTEFIVNRYAKR